MLEIQKYLINGGSFESLNKDLAITCLEHPLDDRIILNYNQIESPKLNSIVRECRGLTINKNDYSLIARGFSRFFNWGEGTKREMNSFNWNKCWINEKVDGSYISIFYWNGKWNVQTRGSFAESKIGVSEYTWRELVEETIDLELLEPVLGRTYIFELCSLYNQVVQIHPEPKLYLLSIFNGELEWNHDIVEQFGKDFGLNRPRCVDCKDPFEVNHFIAREAEKDKRFEGFVLRDSFNNRFKIKSEEYLRLHRLSNNSNIISIKNLVPIVLKGEIDEMIAYFPFIEQAVQKVETEINKLVKEIDNYWFVNSVKKSRKTFASNIQKCPFNNILFSNFGKLYEDVNLRECLLEQSDKVAEYIEGKL